MGFWNHEPAVQQAAEWIRMVQNADGGWGETCGTYDDPTSAASGRARLRKRRGLCLDCWLPGIRVRILWPRVFAGWSNGSTKMEAGTSSCLGRNGESYYTGTGFPRVFYLGYHLYKQYFPLLALTTYERAMKSDAAH